MGPFIVSFIGNGFVATAQDTQLLRRLSPQARRRLLVLAYYTAIASLFTLFGVLIIPGQQGAGPAHARPGVTPRPPASLPCSTHAQRPPARPPTHSLPTPLRRRGARGCRFCEPAADGEPVGGGAGEDAHGAGVSA